MSWLIDESDSRESVVPVKCIAYVRSGRDGNAWMSCTRRVAAETVFCREHRDAANGAVLGLLVRGFPERPDKKQSVRTSARKT
jgi:hypothetical protein